MSNTDHSLILIKQVDKFLYGHPSHYIFNSTKDFKPHAIWLLHDQEGQCNCNGCKKSGGQPRLAAAKEPKRVGRPPKGTSRSASDGSNKGLGSGRTLREKPTAAQMAGNESIFTKLMTKLKREGEVDEMIRDPENIVCTLLYWHIPTNTGTSRPSRSNSTLSLAM